METDNQSVDITTPPEVATTTGGASLVEAMGAVLKAIKPLDALAKAQNEAIARRSATWEAFKPLCQMPQTSDRSLLERQVRKGEEAYLAWYAALTAAETCKLSLSQGEQELATAQAALVQAVSTATASGDDKTLAAAKYMLALLERRPNQCTEQVEEREPAPELSPEDEEALAKLRSAAVDLIATELLIADKHEALEPIVSALSAGSGLKDVALPVRPLEEEIIRYLSGLENCLQRQQERNRKARPLLEERLSLLDQYEGWENAWQEALKQATELPGLAVHRWALEKVVELVVEKSEKNNFRSRYFYETWFCKDPGQLETHDRPTSTAVEKDQIAYLRKQMRVVAVNTAHKREATFALEKTSKEGQAVTPSGVESCESWQGCLDWFEELRAQRQACYLENLRRTTKIELLQRTIQHFTDQETDEMKALYKTFKAMIPLNGPQPSNELRKLIDMADYICQPLHKSD